MRKEALIGTIAIFASLELSKWAFSKRTRDAIKDRARRANNGVLASELSGRSDMPCECAHLSHDRNDPNYDKPSQGIYLTIEEHLNQHIQEEGRNGLSIEHNRWSIAQLQRRLDQWKEDQKDWKKERIDITLFQHTGK